jgi:TRAP-type C4-dicarboxylate transport system substrate-binding protein
LIMAIALATATVSAQSQDAKPGNPNELKLSVAVGPAYALGAAGAQWAKRIAEKSNGRLSAKLFPGATLSQRDAAREFVALRDGAADLAVGSSLYWSAQAPSLGVIGLPCSPRSVATRCLTKGPWPMCYWHPWIAPACRRWLWLPLGHRNASRERSIRVPADLAGLKVRSRVHRLSPGCTQLRCAAADDGVHRFAGCIAAGTLDLQDGHRRHSRALISKRWA